MWQVLDISDTTGGGLQGGGYISIIIVNKKGFGCHGKGKNSNYRAGSIFFPPKKLSSYFLYPQKCF